MNQVQSQAPNGRRTILLLVTGALLLTFGWMLAGGASVEAKAATAAAAPTKAATINGQQITIADVEKQAAEKLDELDLQHQQMEMRFKQERQNTLRMTLDEMVETRLLEMEAKAAGKTSEQLLAENVKAKEISDADVDAFYAQLQQQRPQGLPPKEQIAGQIKTHLGDQDKAEARGRYITELKAKYKVETFIEEPRTEVAAVGPSRGPEGAPVTIVEFSDFQCPFCSRVVPTLEQVKTKYGDNVRLVFRQFPLNSIHPQAQKAAEASLCADEQGKFWQMHDAMFADQKALEVADLKSKATAIGLDAEKFGSCLDNGKFAAKVKEDTRAGSLVGVSGTPALFINGRSLSGAQPFEAISAIIDEELAKAGKSGKG